LEEETVIAPYIKATNVTIKGTTGTGTPIRSTTITAIEADGSIIVPADGSIVAGGETNNVTIKGATLGAGKYTGTDGKLAIDDTDGGEIEVNNGGTIEIAGSGNLEFEKAAIKVTLKEGGSLDVKSADGKFGASTLTNTTITVENSGGPGAATKATKSGSSPNWTVTTEAGATGESLTEIILGKLTLPSSTGALNAAGCTQASTGAAGKLTAGTKTVIIFAGTG
jgi:hypothetical protein